MKLAILSRAPEIYSTRRLIEAAEYRGHEVKVFDTLKFALDLNHGEPDLYYRGKEIDEETLENNSQTIFDEAENRLHVQKAVIQWIVS